MKNLAVTLTTQDDNGTMTNYTWTSLDPVLIGVIGRVLDWAGPPNIEQVIDGEALKDIADVAQTLPTITRE